VHVFSIAGWSSPNVFAARSSFLLLVECRLLLVTGSLDATSRFFDFWPGFVTSFLIVIPVLT
jgi:hypothetical protein